MDNEEIKIENDDKEEESQQEYRTNIKLKIITLY